MNGCRIKDTTYSGGFGSASFCRCTIRGTDCDNPECSDFHDWNPHYTFYNRDQKREISQAGELTTKPLTEHSSGLPPSKVKIMDKLEDIKALPMEVRHIIRDWAKLLQVEELMGLKFE